MAPFIELVLTIHPTVWIGSTSAQSVILDFDTGSSETWVSPPCTSMSDYPEFEELCRELGTYVPDQSFSAVDLNETCPSHWLMYGSGSVFIRYYKDVIQFSGNYVCYCLADSC